jgi:hypothetical protein
LFVLRRPREKLSQRINSRAAFYFSSWGSVFASCSDLAKASRKS